MESLNTVIIEGVCTNRMSHCTFAGTGEISYSPWIMVTGNEGRFYVEVKFSSYFKGADDPKYRAIYDNVKPGRGVRVVGSLQIDEYENAKIIAEHIEFGPDIEEEGEE